MASPARKQTATPRRCDGVLSRIAFQHAKRQGINVAPLLQRAGLTIEDIKNRGTRIEVDKQIEFIKLVAEALDDELLGFHLTEGFDFREIGLMYYVAASADTLGGALRRVERYVKIQNEGIRLKVTRGKFVRLRFYYAGVARHVDIHQMWSLIAVVIRISRYLTGRPLKPTLVRIMHQVPGDKASLERYLDSQIQTGSDADEIDFPAASWNLPIVSADPHLHRLCVQACEEALVRRSKKPTSLKVRVENAIAALLPHGQARLDSVAAMLGVSPRTLARRLADESSSFGGILAELRSALADRYLADRTLPISQIAWLLGYAEIGAFTRAYQRWSGMPPSAARARHQHSTD